MTDHQSGRTDEPGSVMDSLADPDPRAFDEAPELPNAWTPEARELAGEPARENGDDGPSGDEHYVEPLAEPVHDPASTAPRARRNSSHRRQRPSWSARRRQALRAARTPVPQMCSRWSLIGVVVATALAGLLFGPAFGSRWPVAVVVPVLAVTASVYLLAEIGRRWPVVEHWRAVASVVLGVLVVVETTMHRTTYYGLPTGDSLRALDEAVRSSWLRTLQTTAPAPPDPELVAFVPLLVLVALVVAVQMLTRTQARLGALVPGLLVVALAQAFSPVGLWSGVAVATAFVVAAALVLGSFASFRLRAALVTVAAILPIVLIATLLAAVVDPGGRDAFVLRDKVAPATKPTSFVNPLDDVAFRLQRPNEKLFRVSGPADTGLWPISILDRFDGSNWTSSATFRRLGSRLTVTDTADVPTVAHRARVSIDALPGPFLPSQEGLDSITGIRPVVDVSTGELLSPTVKTGTSYSVGWRSPDLDADNLARAALTPGAAQGTDGIGDIPQDIEALARSLAGNSSPTFATALAIERFLRTNYRQAVGSRLPAGYGLRQIARFLGSGQEVKAGQPRGTGTSVQFATSFVLLARIIGIPARVAVGYRQPSRPEADGRYLITGGDALAWPEVSVRNVGWVPLDPIGADSKANTADQNPISRSVDKARSELPTATKNTPAPTPRDPAVPREQPDRGPDLVRWIMWAAIVVLVLGLLRITGVIAVKVVRTRLRRRRSGHDAIVSAWLEARDQLRDHGVAITNDMTVRDAGRASRRQLGDSTAQAMERLSNLVDLAMWSGSLISRYPADVAWQASDAVRTTLSAQPLYRRLAAKTALRGLRPMT